MCADGLEIVEDDLSFTVTCMGCGQEILPSACDWDLFRLGYRSHKDNDCYNLMLTNLGISTTGMGMLPISLD